MKEWLRRLARVLRPGRGRHRGRPGYLARREALKEHVVWIEELLERTPPAEARPPEPWEPRVARWVRLAFPQPDDTIIMGIRPWAY